MSDSTGPSSLAVFGTLHLAILVLRRHFVLFFLITVLFLAPQMLFEVDALLTHVLDWPLLWQVLKVIVGQIARVMISLFLVHAILQAIDGRAVSLKASIFWGMRSLRPVIAVHFLLFSWFPITRIFLHEIGFQWYFPLILFEFAVNIVLLTYFSTALPSLIVERGGILHCLKRSVFLTRGYRWEIVAVWLIISVVLVAMHFGAVLTIDVRSGTFGVFILVEQLVGFLQVLFGTILSTVLYLKLRILKEGSDPDRIAAVFD